jgi:hypothetical protein
VRSLFDQYKQPENQLTHALAMTLSHDRSLIRPFLRWLGIQDSPPLSRLSVVEQQVPGEFTPAEEDESSGLPDLCVFDADGWAVLFEAKVQAGISAGQLRRHLSTARRYGYERPHLVVLAVDRPGRLPSGAISAEWRDVYAWFSHKAGQSFWARQLVEYMRVFENRMIAQNYSIRGTITMFDGLRFDRDNPLTYREGKRLIRLLGDELQARKDLHKLGVDPKGARRSAITGSDGDFVWDFLPLRCARGAGNFTDYPHLTIDLHRGQCSAAVTIPNGVKGGFRSKLREIGPDGFRRLAERVVNGAGPVLRRSKSARPMAYILQRHFKSQRSLGTTDGRMVVDLRTIRRAKSKPVKYQPEWIEAMHALLANKKSNIQLGFVVEFGYDCPTIRSPQAIELFADSWKGMKPVLDFVLHDKQP